MKAINGDDVLEVLKGIKCETDSVAGKAVCDAAIGVIYHLPELNTAELKHSRWIKSFAAGFNCKNCNKWSVEASLFCPRCGFVMDENDPDKERKKYVKSY